MRKVIAATVIGVSAAVGALVAAQPAQACTIVQCPPVPDRQCGVSGKLCRISVHMGPHRTHR